MSGVSDTPVFATARLTMRPLICEDAPALFPTLSDPAQRRYLLQPAFDDIDKPGDWLCDVAWKGRN